MTPLEFRQLQADFERALALAPPEREVFLNRIRSEAPTISAELESLLSVHAHDDEMFFEPAVTRSVLEKALAASRPPREELLLKSGAVVADRYKLESLLGEGGFGHVYLASDSRLDRRKVVLKVLKERPSPQVEKRFQEEVRALSRLDHPGIVSITDSGKLPDGRAYLAMQFVPGSTLKEVLAEGPLNRHRALRILRGMSEALGVSHQAGILHRDIKPTNVILRDTGQPDERPVLLDFGIARTGVAGAGELQTSFLAGTPLYMAPEQLLGRMSAASDIYSLSAIAFEMYTGKPMLECIPSNRSGDGVRDFLSALRPPVPGYIIDAIVRGTAPSVENRFDSIEAFAGAIAAEPPPTRSRRTVLLGALAVLAICVSSVFYRWRPIPPKSVAQPGFELRATLFRRASAGGTPSAIQVGDPLRAGDGIQIFFDASRAGYLYLFDQSSAKQTQFTLLYPGTELGGKPVGPATGQRIPQSPSAWLEIDGKAPQESIWVVWSANRLANLETLRRYSVAPYYGELPQDEGLSLDRWLARSPALPGPERSGEGALVWRSSVDLVVAQINLNIR